MSNNKMGFIMDPNYKAKEEQKQEKSSKETGAGRPKKDREDFIHYTTRISRSNAKAMREMSFYQEITKMEILDQALDEYLRKQGYKK
jgi:hypothetical protein